MQQLKGDGKTVMVDLGNSCSPDVWHCNVTGGRSTLMVLDAMGYTAANIVGMDTDVYEKISEQILMTLIIDDKQTIPIDDNLQLSLRPSESTHIENNVLYLAPPDGVGVVEIHQGGVQSVENKPMPASILPDPSIAGVVDFVISEARYYGSAT